MSGIVKGNFVGQEGGNFPIDAETFQQLQDYIDVVAELSSMYVPGNMDGAILSGCELEESGTRRGAGWLVLSGVGVVPFDGGLVADGLSVVDEDVDVEVGGVVYRAYVRRRCVAGAHLGVKLYRWSNIADKTSLYDVKNYVMPVGSIVRYAGDKSKVDERVWLPCDGRAVSQTTYAELYRVIGTIYNTGTAGSVGIGMFGIPNIADVQNRFIYIIRAK